MENVEQEPQINAVILKIFMIIAQATTNKVPLRYCPKKTTSFSTEAKKNKEKEKKKMSTIRQQQQQKRKHDDDDVNEDVLCFRRIGSSIVDSTVKQPLSLDAVDHRLPMEIARQVKSAMSKLYTMDDLCHGMIEKNKTTRIHLTTEVLEHIKNLQEFRALCVKIGKGEEKIKTRTKEISSDFNNLLEILEPKRERLN